MQCSVRKPILSNENRISDTGDTSFLPPLRPALQTSSLLIRIRKTLRRNERLQYENKGNIFCFHRSGTEEKARFVQEYAYVATL